MEHRCEQRLELDLNARIYHQGKSVATGRIRNAGKHGLFLETDYHNVRKWQKLDLEVALEGATPKKKQNYCLTATVVRRNRQGFGLEVEPESKSEARQLLDIIGHIGEVQFANHRSRSS